MGAVVTVHLRFKSLALLGAAALGLALAGCAGLQAPAPLPSAPLHDEWFAQPAAPAQAVDIFCYQAARHSAALAVCLGGLDAIVFTGGIGENSAEIRARVCKDMDFLGIGIDAAKNQAAVGGKEGDVSAEGARVRTYVIPTNEEIIIARNAWAKLSTNN